MSTDSEICLVFSRRESSPLIISTLWRRSFLVQKEGCLVWRGQLWDSRCLPGSLPGKWPGKATRTKLCLFDRGKRRADGNVYECATLPLLLYRMCHNPQQAPSRAGTEDNMSCLLPVPPPCLPSPQPFFITSSSFPYFSATDTYGHNHLSVLSLSHTHTTPQWLLNRLGNGFLLFNVVWSEAPALTVSEGGPTVVALTHTCMQSLNSRSHAVLVPVHWSLPLPLCLSPSPVLPHSTSSLSPGRPTLTPVLPPSLTFFSWQLT